MWQNHPQIKFTEVTDLCRDTGQLHEGCTFAEVWVTSLNRTNVVASTTGGVQAAVAFPRVEVTTDFVLTNGERPMFEVNHAGSSVRAAPSPFAFKDSWTPSQHTLVSIARISGVSAESALSTHTRHPADVVHTLG